MAGTSVGRTVAPPYSEVEVGCMNEAVVIRLILAGVLGIFLGAILGGFMGMPWWFVFPIALVGGLGIGMA